MYDLRIDKISARTDSTVPSKNSSVKKGLLQKVVKELERDQRENSAA